MAHAPPHPAVDEHSEEVTVERMPPVSASAMERRRSFAAAAREIAARSPMPWDLDVVELLRQDRER